MWYVIIETEVPRRNRTLLLLNRREGKRERERTFTHQTQRRDMAQGKVPIIDLTNTEESHVRELAKEIGDACEKVGFFIVVNHGVPRDVIEGAWLASREFFDMPIDDKKEVSMTPDYMYGYEATEILSNTRDPEVR